MDEYLDEADAERYRELIHKGTIMSPMGSAEYKELSALMDKSLARQIEIFGEPKHTPFEGKCRRCGREFTNPVPDVTHPDGYREIASVEFCAGCNRLVMSLVYRGISAYRVKKLIDPLKGGRDACS